MTNPISSNPPEDYLDGYMLVVKERPRCLNLAVRMLYYNTTYMEWWSTIRWTKNKTGLLRVKSAGFIIERKWKLLSTKAEFGALVMAKIKR